MSADFDWQTEVEEEWEPEAAPPGDDTPAGAGRPWRFLLAVLFLSLAALTLVTRNVSLQVAAVESAVREEVLATHRLIQTAVAERDEELFVSLLDSRDGWWVQAERNLFRQELTYDLYPLGLHLAGAPGEPVTVTFAPDLQSAEVRYPLSYVTIDPAGAERTVQLEQLALYQRMDGRWLLTRPHRNDWGEWIEEEWAGFEVTYSEHDAALGSRLAQHLHDAWEAFCSYTDDCPADYDVQIRLVQHSRSELAQPSLVNNFMGPRVTLGMPSPVLLGRPVDDAAFEALARGYARQVIAYTLQRWYAAASIDGTGLYRDRFFREFDLYGARYFREAAVRRYLADLGLLGWPPWPRPEATTPPLPFPEQELATICVNEAGYGSTLYTYYPAADRWRPQPVAGTPYHLIALPEDDGLLLSLFQGAEPGPDVALLFWRLGRPPARWEGSFLVSVERDGRGGIISQSDGEQGASWYYVSDFSQCTAAGCEQQAISLERRGIGTLSPDGEQQIFWDEHGQLQLQRNTGEEPVSLDILPGDAGSPFWVDDVTFGLVSWPEPDNFLLNEIWLTHTGDLQPRLLVNSQQLAEAVPDPTDERTIMYIAWTMPDPQRSGSYILLATEESVTEPISSRIAYAVHVFQVIENPAGPPDITALAEVDGLPGNDPVLSPSGRWLALDTMPPAQTESKLHLIDLQEGQHRILPVRQEWPILSSPLPFADWSADGEWLVLAEAGILRLYAPAYDYEHQVVPPQPGCTNAAWLDLTR